MRTTIVTTLLVLFTIAAISGTFAPLTTAMLGAVGLLLGLAWPTRNRRRFPFTLALLIVAAMALGLVGAQADIETAAVAFGIAGLTAIGMRLATRSLRGNPRKARRRPKAKVPAAA